MKTARVLFIGSTDASTTSRHRSEALRRLGFQVTDLDLQMSLGNQLQGLKGSVHYRTGYKFLGRVVQSTLVRCLPSGCSFDLCWVDGGELLGPAAVAYLKRVCRRVVLFNHDDPTGKRDRLRFASLRQAIPLYDVCGVVREINVREFRALGAQRTVLLWRSYDEVAHCPVDLDGCVSADLTSDVAFLGRNFDGEGRDLFMVALVDSGIRVAIWGDNWTNSKYWSKLESSFRGANLAGARYVDAIRGSKICLGMLSKGNRDQHTTRSMEIPYAGGLLCAQRTGEHLRLYEEGEEAVFWNDAQECVDKCRALLADPAGRERIRLAGRARVLANRVGNEDLCRAVLANLEGGERAASSARQVQP